MDDIRKGVLGSDFDREDRAEIEAKVREAQEAALTQSLASEIREILTNLGLADRLRVKPGGDEL
jgi:hypothetical protein